MSWVVDNGSSHNGARSIQRMQAAWPTTCLMHLAIHVSWLNQGEIFRSIVQRKVIKTGDFADLEKLAERLLAFQDRSGMPAVVAATHSSCVADWPVSGNTWPYRGPSSSTYTSLDSTPRGHASRLGVGWAPKSSKRTHSCPAAAISPGKLSRSSSRPARTLLMNTRMT